MRLSPYLIGFLSTVAIGAAAPEQQYLSSIHLAVHETSPELLKRSQRLVMDQFNEAFTTWPEFQGNRYEIKTNGNEVMFVMTTSKDMRLPVQDAVAHMIGNLNGRVLARGRSMFYKAELSKPVGGYLEVTVDDTHSKILSVAAQSVTLRDLLKEIKTQVGSISYLIPGECAEQLVDWSFGEMGDAEPKTVDTALSEIATLFSLRMEKKSGTYIFTGNCNEVGHHRAVKPVELLRSNLLPPSLRTNGPMGARVQQVFVPVFPFGE